MPSGNHREVTYSSFESVFYDTCCVFWGIVGFFYGLAKKKTKADDDTALAPFYNY